MPLIKNQYGKGRVRIMRVHKKGEWQEVRELNVKVMLQGDFARAYTDGDNSTSVCTDTMKNLVNIVGFEKPDLDKEQFCEVVAARFLERYPQVDIVTLVAHETKWARLHIDGKAHPHSFTRDDNGRPFVRVIASRSAVTLESGIDSFTFMKSTGSGWENFALDSYTTLAPTADRICATSMVASWTWASRPADFTVANARILEILLKVFATTYSPGVQNSLFLMGEAVLASVPEISEISMACPNIHYIPMNLSAFKIENKGSVFLPTDEPHGQIECTVGR